MLLALLHNIAFDFRMESVWSKIQRRQSKIIKLGETMAMVFYSECLRIGKGTPQNYERCGHNYRMAADLGNKEGIFPMHL